MLANSEAIRTLYQKLIGAWNERNAHEMADLFCEGGESIGFDGSQSIGPEEIVMHLKPIFDNHPTAKFVIKVKSIHFLDSNVAILRSIAGMVPPGKTDINSKVNTHHTIIAVRTNDSWKIQLFQNTPAQFHGRPELIEKMTNELREELIGRQAASVLEET
ncbi:SgcJ/EcaC family oxidoreductase [Paenibacillus macquariensis]|uniref:SnoaL-like domain-containing protein n=1 Tax=Paenibacillus macquariensis TaxID=948756 RepID=A0ABY1KEQ3_9BACL|nr:SgcJ/EcaC family oxidoreductase [Paenibacillus macquariensis]MEC0094193.1 SgcJ/EcaC family oxidoreductase [Paenibacillus macquariensis]OAB25926.1 DUF4440 domain-containing protein [Paenibacillus macquariensis subsp. macquariensis]SIR72141.1 conserved hypothetical protein [Paenibacillus macquariensis]